MAYFSNGTMGMMYEDHFCSRCIHRDGCAVLEAHYLKNYKEANNDESILHILIPRSEDGLHNEPCRMFYEAQNQPHPEPTDQKVKI